MGFYSPSDVWQRGGRATPRVACKKSSEVPEAICRTGEELVRVYMHEVAPQIRPAAVERPLRGVRGGVRIRAQLDLMHEDGTIIDVRTAQAAPARVDRMQRFEWTTCSRLAEGPSGVGMSSCRTAPSGQGRTDRCGEANPLPRGPFCDPGRRGKAER